MKTTQNETAGDKVTIIIAWAEEEMRLVRERRTDLGERPVMALVRVAKTALWLNEGTKEDVAKARAYAAGETDKAIRVYTYRTDHKDPRGAAAKAILAA
jgi:hypothetical protein